MSPIRGYVFDAYGTLFDDKPSPLVYALGPGTLGIPAGELLFVSSNGWDVAGAKAFGCRVAWCNRADAPEEELGVRADLVVRALDQLPAEGAVQNKGGSPRASRPKRQEKPALSYFLPASFFRFT